MKTNKLLAAAALALVIASGANAAGPTLNVGDEAYFYGYIGDNVPDTFTFELASGSGVQGGLYALSLSLTPSPPSMTPASFSWKINNGSFQAFTSTETINVTLGLGEHTLSFLGTNGTYYGGTIAAVPEPETYVMLLAGLGMMGFVARRRLRQS